MAGNVWEWVFDVYHGSYDGAPEDGTAWTAPDGADRVQRGGGFTDIAATLRSAERNAGVVSNRGTLTGARCVRPLP